MKMTNFQIIFTGVFVFFIVLGVSAFALYNSSKGGVGKVVIWGQVDQNLIDTVLQDLRSQDTSFQDVIYVQKNSASYEGDLVDAIASGSSPDLFFIMQDQVQFFKNKVLMIPYSAVSQRTLINSFIDEAQLFQTPEGSLALPFLIDPLVMYWNRNIFSNVAISQPPVYWSDLVDMAPKLTLVDKNLNIQKSAIALGGWKNVTNAKEILGALFLQAGDNIVQRDATGVLQVLFGSTPEGITENPASSALNFYTQFANPSKTMYSWNRSLPMSRDDFIAGDLALYIGFASDLTTITARNPNLRFAVSVLPQIRGNSVQMTTGRLTGVAIPRTAVNMQGALLIAEKLTSQATVSAVASAVGLPPVRRDVSLDTSGNAALSVFVQSALISRGWMDPNPTATDALFQGVVESIVSGKSSPSQAVLDASQALQTLIQQNATQQQ